MVAVKIPSTSANLGVLFDKGGVALDAFTNTIELRESEEFEFNTFGSIKANIPQNEDNLIYKAVKYFYTQTGRAMPVFSITAHNEIPFSRGLGSSAACIAGGISVANYFEGEILSKKEIIEMSAEFEGHGDNVCAAIIGGISLFSKEEYVNLPLDDDIGFIIYVPKTTLSTKKSRAILPEKYDNETLEKANNLEISMIKALKNKDYEKAGNLMEMDVLHQPYRKKLFPYWNDVLKAAKDFGVWGTALSGAGPTMISMCSKKKMHKISLNMKNSVANTYKLNIIECEINPDGITLTEGLHEKQGQDC